MEPTSFYQKGEEDWWGISRYYKQIKIGEEAYIWQSIDYRFHQHKPRGIYAKAVVVSYPPHSQQHQMRIDDLKRHDTGKWQSREEEKRQKTKLNLLIMYTACYVINPLTEDDLMMAGLDTIGPFRFIHSEIYKLDDSDALIIQGLLASKSEP